MIDPRGYSEFSEPDFSPQLASAWPAGSLGR